MNPNIQACQFQNWFPAFRKQTIQSRIIPLSKDFIDFLEEDGVTLPPSLAPTRRQEAAAFSDDDIWSDDDDADEDDKDSTPFFPELIAKINTALEELGNRVFVKLNWNSARDSQWIMCGQTLQATTAGDVILMLQSSDRVLEGYKLSSSSEQPDEKAEAQQNNDIEWHLVLRKWSNLNPSGEFRCFVKDNHLVGASQRYPSYLEHMQQDTEQQRLKQTLLSFYADHIVGNFPLSSFIYDVYVDSNAKVWAIDFHPFHDGVDSVLFSWSEPPLTKTMVTSSDSTLADEDNENNGNNDDKLNEQNTQDYSKLNLDDSSPTTAAKFEGSDLKFDFRFCKSRAEAEMHIPRVAASIVNRLPADNIDISDAEGIKRFARLSAQGGLVDILPDINPDQANIDISQLQALVQQQALEDSSSDDGDDDGDNVAP